MSMRALLVDIEGTTTDIAFVHRVLFPIARAEVPRFVREHPADPAVAEVRRGLAGHDGGRLPSAVSDDEVIAQLIAWIDADAKITPLKAIQGAIWREAYEKGDLESHVYDDVAPAFQRLHAAGVAIHVFSSGSVEAQRLLFAHTTAGDLRPYLHGYFDTTTGPKREAASYARIAAAVGLAPSDVLFASDVLAELDAAREAGMQTLWMLRAGTRECPSDHPRARDFCDLHA